MVIIVKVVKKTPKLDRLKKEVKFLKTYGVKVGYFGIKADEETESGTKVYQYSFILNHGSVFMPPRPFWDDAVVNKKGRDKIIEKQKEVLQMVYMGELTGRQALEQIGIFIKEEVQDNIISNNYAPVKDSTEKRKTRNKGNTLREHDRMRDAVFFEIVKI